MNYLIGFLVIAAILYGCSPGWKQQLDTERDLPWCGKNQKVILETKTTSAPFSTTGSRSHMRWVTTKSKLNPSRYATNIDNYLKEIGLMDQWPKSGSYVGTEDGTKQLIRAPYIFELASIEPLIVFMRPKMEQDGKKYRADLLTSSYLTNYFYYGTQFLYHPETLWFSPDLNQKPIDLGLIQGQKIKIKLTNDQLVLKENNGMIKITRE